MNKLNKITKITLNNNLSNQIKINHPWIYKESFKGRERLLKQLRTGDSVGLYDQANNFLAYALFDEDSDIALRVFSRSSKEIDWESLFYKRIFKAFSLRKKIIDKSCTTAYRLVYGESDRLPGLVVDIYDKFAVIVVYTPSLLDFIPIIAKILIEKFQYKGIYLKERFKPKTGNLEKSSSCKFIMGEEIIDKLQVLENGFNFVVDVEHGQKTGLFLDQRDNRLSIMKYCKGKTVLNCFSYTAAFSVYAAKAGAKKVVSVDLAKWVRAWAIDNFTINDINAEDHVFICGDVFEVLNRDIKKGRKYDMVIMDPPAFARSKKHVFSALKGYKEINRLALKVLEPGGVLVSSSCSTQITPKMLLESINEAAISVNRKVHVVEMRGQAPDHPIISSFPEGNYLKFFICIVDNGEEKD